MNNGNSSRAREQKSRKTMRTIHDRFLLVDDKVYHFGASFLKYECREQRLCLH